MKSHLELARIFQDQESWETIGTDTQFRILDLQDEIVIVFCQSNSRKDWRINFAFPKKPYKRMPNPFLVHGGFLQEWKRINDHFIRLVDGILQGPGAGKQITITGWSYGGAMATLCHEDLWFNFPQIRDSLRLVTFGSPRVIGWKNFSQVSDRWSRATLYTNGTDIVTMVPPVIFGFRHVRKQTHIGAKRRLIDVFRPRLYHHIDGYASSLQEAKG
jgi:predicted lipase